MRFWQRKLGGEDALIFAPEAGTFDHDVFRCSFPSGGVYGLDVETTAITDLGQWDPDFRVRLVQFGTHGYAWVLDMEDPVQHEAALALLSDEANTFISHNNYDVLSVRLGLDVDIVDRNIDTLVLSHMSLTDRDEHKLKPLVSDFIGPELADAEDALHKVFHSLWTGKSNAKLDDIVANGWNTVDKSSQAYLIYAGLDAIACLRLAPILVKVGQQPANLIEVEIWLAQQANRIQLRGFLVDQKMLDEVDVETKSHTVSSEKTIAEVTGLKARSPKIVNWLSEHGVDFETWTGDRTKTGNVSLAKSNVNLLSAYPLDDDGRRVVGSLVKFRSWLDRSLKVDQTRKYLAPDGCVHAVLRSNGAHQTSRMSSASPNMQNFSKKDPRTRGIFVPRRGFTLVNCDFDQVELRVVAALANETKMIEAILAGVDLHQLTADEVRKPRPIGKMTNFLVVYGGGGPALSSQAGMPIDEARETVARFREAYPGIAEYANELAQYSAIRTISNRRLVAPRDRDGRSRSYANINYMVQSSARELLVEAWWRLAHQFGRGLMVWLPIHDELVLEVPNDEVEQVMREVESCMTFDFMGVPITASAGVLADSQGVSRWGK